MALFGAKNSEEVSNEQAGSIGSPIDLVLNMREQGLSNNQIITSLQRECKVVKEVHAGYECAFICDKFQDWQEGDKVNFLLEQKVSN